MTEKHDLTWISFLNEGGYSCLHNFGGRRVGRAGGAKVGEVEGLFQTSVLGKAHQASVHKGKDFSRILKRES